MAKGAVTALRFGRCPRCRIVLLPIHVGPVTSRCDRCELDVLTVEAHAAMLVPEVPPVPVPEAAAAAALGPLVDLAPGQLGRCPACDIVLLPIHMGPRTSTCDRCQHAWPTADVLARMQAAPGTQPTTLGLPVRGREFKRCPTCGVVLLPIHVTATEGHCDFCELTWPWQPTDVRAVTWPADLHLHHGSDAAAPTVEGDPFRTAVAPRPRVVTLHWRVAAGAAAWHDRWLPRRWRGETVEQWWVRLDATTLTVRRAPVAPDAAADGLAWVAASPEVGTLVADVEVASIRQVYVTAIDGAQAATSPMLWVMLDRHPWRLALCAVDDQARAECIEAVIEDALRLQDAAVAGSVAERTTRRRDLGLP